MDDQRAGVADIGEVREEFQTFDEGLAGFVAAFEAEGEDGPCPLGRIAALQRMVRVVLQSGICLLYTSPSPRD